MVLITRKCQLVAMTMVSDGSSLMTMLSNKQATTHYSESVKPGSERSLKQTVDFLLVGSEMLQLMSFH